MKVAVICEFSGTVRDAFIRQGHEAISFDLINSESTSGPHVTGDVELLGRDYFSQFDLAICHPPCTYLAVSGARWFSSRLDKQEQALSFVKWLMCLPVLKIAIENPVSVISTHIQKPDQIIQPWMFGHGETKKTCLWLKGLPKLVATKVVDGRVPKIHLMPPSVSRGRERSRTCEGIAEAMASQWGVPQQELISKAS